MWPTPCHRAQDDPAARPSMKDVVDRLLAVGRVPTANKLPLNDSARSLGGAERRAAKAESPCQLSASVSEKGKSSAEQDAGGNA